MHKFRKYLIGAIGVAMTIVGSTSAFAYTYGGLPGPFGGVLRCKDGSYYSFKPSDKDSYDRAVYLCNLNGKGVDKVVQNAGDMIAKPPVVISAGRNTVSLQGALSAIDAPIAASLHAISRDRAMFGKLRELILRDDSRGIRELVGANLPATRGRRITLDRVYIGPMTQTVFTWIPETGCNNSVYYQIGSNVMSMDTSCL